MLSDYQPYHRILPYAVIFSDLKTGEILDCNSTAEKLTGMTRSDIIKLTRSSLFLHDKTTDSHEQSHGGLAKGDSLSYEAQLLTKEGHNIPVFVDASIAEIGGKDVAIEVVAGTAERKQAEEALQDSEAKYQPVVEQLLEGILIAQDNPLRLVFANPAMAKLLQFTAEELTSLPSEDIEGLVHPENREAFFQHFRDRLEGKLIPESHEFRAVRKDGTAIWLAVSSSRIDYGVEPAVLAVFKDITEHKHMDEELERARDEMELRFEERSTELQEVNEQLQAEVTIRKQIHEALRSERDYSESLVETAQTIVLVLDTEGRIVRFNPYMEEISGYRIEEVQGKDWFVTFLPKHIRQHTRELFLEALEDIQARCNVNVIITKDGREREIEWHDKALRGADGNASGLLAVGQDITERRQAEEALRESEERYRDLYQNAPVAYFSVSTADGSITECNTAATQLLGYDGETLTQMKVLELYADTPDGIAKAKEVFSRFLVGESIRDVELQMKHKDGTPIWISLSLEPVRGRDGSITESRSMAIDITTRKQAEEALKLERDLMSAIFDTTGTLIVLVDTEGRIVHFNKSAERMTGYTFDKVHGKRFWDLFAIPGETETLKAVFEPLKSGSIPPGPYENHWVMNDGTRRLIAWTGNALLDKSGTVEYIAATGIDVTERRRAESLLAEQENIRIYAHLVTQTQELERRRISRELHDETVQSLARLGLDIDRLTNSKQKLPEDVRESLEELRKRTDDILQGVRRFSQALRPPMLEELGLLDSLRWMADNLTGQHGLTVSVRVLGKPRRLPPQKELVLFRIAQEALQNVWKHSQATEAVVTAEFNQQGIRLSITDNGRGFEMPERVGDFARLGKLGAMGMQERAALAGGTFSVHSEPNAGTTVTVSLNE
jgi:PAS domain S-box-containing protein